MAIPQHIFMCDGLLVAAVEKERFRRIKHWAGFPSESIRYCLEAVGINLADVEYIAVNTDSKASLLQNFIPVVFLERVRSFRFYFF